MGRLEAARDEVSGWKWVIRWKPEENRKEVCEGVTGHAFWKIVKSSLAVELVLSEADLRAFIF